MKKSIAIILSVAICSCTKKDNTPVTGKIQFVNNSQEQYACYVDDTLGCTILPADSFTFTVKPGEHTFEIEQLTGFPKIAEDGDITITSSKPYVIPVN